MNSADRTQKARALPIAALALAAAPLAHGAGWGFTPTPAEWESWPQYCRIQYSYINRGQNKYGDYYSDAAIAPWKAMIGEKTFGSMHHYCKAMIVLKQIRAEKNSNTRKFLVGVAVDDSDYTYQRADPQSIAYPAIASVMGQAKLLNGDIEEGFAILERAIEAQPTRYEAYAALAAYYREQRQVDLALKTVQRADEANHGESAEIQYNLGLLNVEAGNVDAAVANAKAAYAKGYPLPGLARKLEKLKRWPPPAETAAETPASQPQ
ncbi:MAG: tetratricopeptide repeat protein [Steroidobacteraceae bacterium]